MMRPLGARGRTTVLAGRMHRGAALIAVAMIVLTGAAALAPAQAAPWLQYNHDAARTGATEDPGPETEDLVFHTQLPGGRGQFVSPLIINRYAYVATTDMSPSFGPEISEAGIFRIGLDTGEVDKIVDLDVRSSGEECAFPLIDNCYRFYESPSFASDGNRFFVTERSAVRAYPLAGGDPEWEWPYPGPVGEEVEATCSAPAVAEERLYLWCYTGLQTEPHQQIFVAALDTHDGTERWVSLRETHTDPLGGEGPDACQTMGDALGDMVPEVQSTCVSDRMELLLSIAVVERYVVVTSVTLQSVLLGILQNEGQAHAPVRDAISGSWAGSIHVYNEDDGSLRSSRSQDLGPWVQGESTWMTQTPTGTRSSIFMQIDGALRALRTNNLDAEIWRDETIGGMDERGRSAGTGVALAGDTLYAATATLIYRYENVHDPPAGGLPPPRSQVTFDPPFEPDESWDFKGLNYAGGNLYARTWTKPCDGCQASVEKLYSIDVKTGKTSLMWEIDSSMDYVPFFTVHAIGEGVLVAVTRDGQVRVFGETGASIQVQADYPGVYPAAGEEVVVDLSSSLPGLHGAPDRFRADWGDGTVTQWQPEPVFTHSYATTGDMLARFQAGNAEGQTASHLVTFHVGGSPDGSASNSALFPLWALLVPSGALVAAVALVLVALLFIVRRRQEALAEDRLAVYRQAVERDVAHHESPSALAAHLKPLRAVIGISEREHARIEAEVRARLALIGGVARVLVPGDRFLDRYEVIRLIAAGGQGHTYLCRDLQLDRMVVLKVVHAEKGTDSKRLLKEARAFAMIRHDRIVTLHDVEQVGDDLILVLDYVPGGTLRERMKVGSLPAAELAALGEDLLGALAAVHAAGITHLDVKPANVLVDGDGRFQLADFGIAHLPGRDATMQGLGGSQSGTLRYMSPEQARGGPVGAHSDLYSAALTLYEAGTGSLPETERTDTTDPAKGSSARQPRGKDPLAVFFARALAQRPGDRYPDAQAMARAWQDALKAQARIRAGTTGLQPKP